jgi:hypothetical protein
VRSKILNNFARTFQPTLRWHTKSFLVLAWGPIIKMQRKCPIGRPNLDENELALFI